MIKAATNATFDHVLLARRIQTCRKRQRLGCVNSAPATRRSQEAGFTQPRCLFLHLPSFLTPSDTNAVGGRACNTFICSSYIMWPPWNVCTDRSQSCDDRHKLRIKSFGKSNVLPATCTCTHTCHYCQGRPAICKQQ